MSVREDAEINCKMSQLIISCLAQHRYILKGAIQIKCVVIIIIRIPLSGGTLLKLLVLLLLGFQKPIVLVSILDFFSLFSA